MMSTDWEMLIKQQKFRQKLGNKKYPTLPLNGREALDKIQQNPEIAIVLSDTGLTLLSHQTSSPP
jgi:hypothetical protein